MTKMKNSNRITLLNVASTAVLQGLAFISGPIFSNALGSNNYGIVSVYFAWTQIASIIFTLQAGEAIAVARVNYPVTEQKQYQSSVLFLATVSYAILSTLVLLFVSLTSNVFSFNVPMFILGLIQGWGMYCVAFMNLKFVYELKAGINLILSVSVSVLTIGVSLLFMNYNKPENNYWGRIIGQSVVYFLVGILIFVYVVRIGKTFFNREYWKFTLPITLPIIFHSLAHIVLNQSDRIMVQMMIDNSAAGVYALAGNFALVINSIWGAFNNSWAPQYYEYTKANQIEEMKRHAKNYLELFTIITVGFILLSREVFHLYAAKGDFWDGTDYIPLLALGYFFVFLYSFPVNFEFYNKKTKIIAIGTIAAAICNIVMNYVLISLVGAFGAVIATSISYSLLFIFHLICANRVQEMKFPFKIFDFSFPLLAVVLACILYWFTRNAWPIRWGIGFVLGIIVFIKTIKRKEIF